MEVIELTKTKRGIYHNLNDSTYSTSNNEVEYFFSSVFYLDKFMEEYYKNRVEIRKRLGRVIDCTNLNFDLLADFHLYKSIEKRGFRISIKGCDVSWQNCLLFALQNVTRKNIDDYVETQRQK